MPNLHKAGVLQTLRARLGELKKSRAANHCSDLVKMRRESIFGIQKCTLGEEPSLESAQLTCGS
jgi:hypothetical protein